MCSNRTMHVRYGTDDPSTGKSLYSNVDFARAWKLLLDAAELEPSLREVSTYRHDVVDVTRQALAKHAARVYANVSKAWSANSSEGLTREGSVTRTDAHAPHAHTHTHARARALTARPYAHIYPPPSHAHIRTYWPS